MPIKVSGSYTFICCKNTYLQGFHLELNLFIAGFFFPPLSPGSDLENEERVRTFLTTRRCYQSVQPPCFSWNFPAPRILPTSTSPGPRPCPTRPTSITSNRIISCLITILLILSSISISSNSSTYSCPTIFPVPRARVPVPAPSDPQHPRRRCPPLQLTKGSKRISLTTWARQQRLDGSIC